MNGYLRQSTASQARLIGPFIDSTDFATAKTGLTVANTDIKLRANGTTLANKNSGGGTHQANGMYSVTWDATDTANVGELFYSVVIAGALQVFGSYTVLEEAVYDALFAASAAGFGTAQTGDAFARLGAPVGASVSADVAGVQADTNDLQARLPAALTANGNMKSSLVEILTTALTETAGLLAAAFKKFFNVATPTGTVNSLPDAVAGAASGLSIVGSNMGTATSVTGAVGSVTGNVGGNVTGSVGSVVGAVGSVTGAVGSVTGNVGGNVTGSVGSVVGAVGSVTGAVGSVAAGGITAASIADDAITAAKIADGAIDAATFAAGAINAAALAANAINAAKLDPDVTTELQAGLATAAALTTAQAGLDDIQARLPAALTGDGNIKADALKFEGADPTDTITASVPTAAAITTAVWAAGTRSLTTFGSLVADVATAVWASGTRTLTSFGTLVADVATAVAAALDTGLTAIFGAASSAATDAAAAAASAASAATDAASAAASSATVEGRLTAGRATNLDNLDAAVSTRLAAASITLASGKVTPVDVDGLSFVEAMEVLLALEGGVTERTSESPLIVQFNKRDGTTAKVTVQYGAVDGVRDVSTVA